MNEVNERFQELMTLLAQCRAERDLTLKEVGKAVKLTAGAVSNIETGKSIPRRTTWLKLEAFLRKHGYFPKVAA